MSENPNSGMATTGTWIQQPGQKPPSYRCASCGAFGNATLCPKCWALHLQAMDMHANGLFSALISAWNNSPKFCAELIKAGIKKEEKKSGK